MGFVGNLLGFPAVKEFWKSVKNWQSYCHEFGVQFFGPPCMLTIWILYVHATDWSVWFSDLLLVACARRTFAHLTWSLTDRWLVYVWHQAFELKYSAIDECPVIIQVHRRRGCLHVAYVCCRWKWPQLSCPVKLKVVGLCPQRDVLEFVSCGLGVASWNCDISVVGIFVNQISRRCILARRLTLAYPPCHTALQVRLAGYSWWSLKLACGVFLRRQSLAVSHKSLVLLELMRLTRIWLRLAIHLCRFSKQEHWPRSGQLALADSSRV